MDKLEIDIARELEAAEERIWAKIKERMEEYRKDKKLRKEMEKDIEERFG